MLFAPHQKMGAGGGGGGAHTRFYLSTAPSGLQSSLANLGGGRGGRKEPLAKATPCCVNGNHFTQRLRDLCGNKNKIAE